MSIIKTPDSAQNPNTNVSPFPTRIIKNGNLTASQVARLIVRNGSPVSRQTIYRMRNNQELPAARKYGGKSYWSAEQIHLAEANLIAPNWQNSDWLAKHPNFEDIPDLLRESAIWCKYDPNSQSWTPLPNQYRDPYPHMYIKHERPDLLNQTG